MTMTATRPKRSRSPLMHSSTSATLLALLVSVSVSMLMPLANAQIELFTQLVESVQESFLAGDISQDQASTLIETAAETSGITFNFDEGLSDVDFIIYSAFGFLSPAWSDESSHAFVDFSSEALPLPPDFNISISVSLQSGPGANFSIVTQSTDNLLTADKVLYFFFNDQGSPDIGNLELVLQGPQSPAIVEPLGNFLLFDLGMPLENGWFSGRVDLEDVIEDEDDVYNRITIRNAQGHPSSFSLADIVVTLPDPMLPASPSPPPPPPPMILVQLGALQLSAFTEFNTPAPFVFAIQIMSAVPIGAFLFRFTSADPGSPLSVLHPLPLFVGSGRAGDIIGAGGGLVALEPELSLTINAIDDSLSGSFDENAEDNLIEPVALFDTLVLVATAAADVQICLDEFVFLAPPVPPVSGLSPIAAQLINGPCITIPATVQNVLPQTPEETDPMPDFLNDLSLIFGDILSPFWLFSVTINSVAASPRVFPTGKGQFAGEAALRIEIPGHTAARFTLNAEDPPSPFIQAVEAIIFPLESLFNVQLQALDSTGSVIISTSLSSLTPHKFAVVQLHLPEGVFDIISTIQFISLMPSGHETQDFIVDNFTVTFLDLTPPLDLPPGLPFEVEQFIQHECSSGQFVLMLNATDPIIQGTPGHDCIISTGNQSAIIYGLGGADIIVSLNQSDTIYGGAGNDIIYGLAGIDFIYGGHGHDTMYGGQQNDLIYGEDGSDVIYGGHHDDTIYGGLHDDYIYGNAGSDLIYGDDGDDRLYGGMSIDILRGGHGHDTLYGESGIDSLNGDEGRDIYFGGPSSDFIEICFGEDVSGDLTAPEDMLMNSCVPNTQNFEITDTALSQISALCAIEACHIRNAGSEGGVLAGTPGMDFLIGSNTHDIIYGYQGSDIILGFGSGDIIYGGSQKDLILAGRGRDTIYGEGGQDTIYGERGADTVYGGAGKDTLVGGPGPDTLVGEGAKDLLLAGNDSHDKVIQGSFEQ